MRHSVSPPIFFYTKWNNMEALQYYQQGTHGMLKLSTYVYLEDYYIGLNCKQFYSVAITLNWSMDTWRSHY